MGRKKEEKNYAIEAFKKRLGRNIKALRYGSGLTANDFIESIGITRGQLWKMEKATANFMSLKTLFFLSNKINLQELFSREMFCSVIAEQKDKDED
jgi:transcriptional regulator with XRE-family HTH domain